jgi:hypothetical protein
MSGAVFPQEGPHPGRSEGEHQQRGFGVGQGRDTVALRVTLLGIETLEAADVEEEVERAQIGRRQVRHVPHDVGGANRALDHQSGARQTCSSAPPPDPR